MTASSVSEAPIFLIGFMASGKSTVGRILAARLGWTFRDLDALVVEEAGRPVPEIFAAEGEAGFRQRETAAVRTAAGLRRTVIATGGGAPCREENLTAMLDAGLVVDLVVTPDEVLRRARDRSSRPLLANAADPRQAIVDLMDARAPFYARAHARVSTDGRGAEAVASDVLRVIEARSPVTTTIATTTIPVPLGDRAYEVRIGSFEPDAVAAALAAAFGATSGVAVLVDGQVGRVSPRVESLVAALGARLSPTPVRRFDLAPGEGCKSLGEVQKTIEWMAAAGFDRGAVVVAIGGGAASDHAGFAAAIYLRGVRFAICPTTLLAMVDASVGGKTGVDLGAGKNLVGAFHQPRAVIADLAFLGTLPARERVAGLAEVVKVGLVADAALIEDLEANADTLAASSEHPRLQAIIAAAVRIKAEVVTEDERESGRRAILNFGHTVGHAIEAASGYELLHGEAVSLGMVVALSLGVSLGVTPPALRDRGRALLQRLGLPVDAEARLRPEVLGRIDVDKKRRGSSVRFVLVEDAGRCVLRDIPLDELRARLARPAGA